jgi:transposase
VMRRQPILKQESSFIGIDDHKRYSVFCVLDAQGVVLERGRIDHLCPEQLVALVRRWPGCRVVFEACMNWHWLLESLEEAMPREDIVLANPFKTRIIAEAQIKTDKVDARILADLLRGNLIARVHIWGKATRRDKRSAAPAMFLCAAAHHAAQSDASTPWGSARAQTAPV